MQASETGDTKTAQLGWHLNRPFLEDRRLNVSVFANPFAITSIDGSKKYSPQLTLDSELLLGGDPQKGGAPHSLINVGVNVSVGMLQFDQATISGVGNLTGNFLYRGSDTPRLTPWVEVYRSDTRGGSASGAEGGTGGITWNQPTGGAGSSIWSFGAFLGLRKQWAEEHGVSTTQTSVIGGIGIGRSW